MTDQTDPQEPDASSSICIDLYSPLLAELDTAAAADGCSREEKARRILTAVLTTPVLSGRRVARTRRDLLEDAADSFALQLEQIRWALREAINEDGSQAWDERLPPWEAIRWLIDAAGLPRSRTYGSAVPANLRQGAREQPPPTDHDQEA